MSTVPPVSLPSVRSVPSISQSSLWNTRSVTVLCGVAAVLLFLIYDMIRDLRAPKNEQPSQEKPDLSDRLMTQLFPLAANCNNQLCFSHYAAGLVRINLDSVRYYSKDSGEPVFINCTWNQWSFRQPMIYTSSADFPLQVFIPEMPFEHGLKVRFTQGQTPLFKVTLDVTDEMGIYEFANVSDKPTLNFHPASSTQIGPHHPFTRSVKEPLMILIPLQGPLEFRDRELGVGNYLICNTTDKTHVLFFEITDTISSTPAEVRLVVSIVAPPQEDPISVPHKLLLNSWEDTYLATHGKLYFQFTPTLLSITDTVI